MFKDLNMSIHYESVKEKNIVRDFYLPVLSSTKIYKRIIGHLSTESLVIASKGLVELIENGGSYRILTAINLDEENIENLNKNEASKRQILESVLMESLKAPIDSFQQARIDSLINLLEKNQLQIKLLIPRDLSFKGIHYERVGIVEDFEGEKMAFTTQINETPGEYISNYETLEVFPSWNEYDELRLKKKEERFEQLWNGKDERYEVIDIPISIKNLMLSFKGKSDKLIEPEIQIEHKVDPILDMFPKIPSFIEIREYQQDAIRSWFRNNCQGLLEMATGTGKTITALSATAKLWEVTRRLGIVIVCPYTHLVDQWVEDIKLFNMSPIIAYQSRTLWEDALYSEVSAFKSGIINHFCLITTVSTFTTKAMQKILNELSSDVLFIADEAHHLGAKKEQRELNY